jgi:hypothetical protein
VTWVRARAWVPVTGPREGADAASQRDRVEPGDGAAAALPGLRPTSPEMVDHIGGVASVYNYTQAITTEGGRREGQKALAGGRGATS